MRGGPFRWRDEKPRAGEVRLLALRESDNPDENRKNALPLSPTFAFGYGGQAASGVLDCFDSGSTARAARRLQLLDGSPAH